MRDLCLSGLILFLGTSITNGAEPFPYRIAIKDRDVTVRSGPGEQFYATSRLVAGDEIEVYERKAGGWLAIRPPESSFNWVEANKLRMTNDPDVAKVVGNSVVAWVGSELGTISEHKWQVRLEPGESVQLMARRSLSIFKGDESRDFYQISPPSGDFRWVNERDVNPLVKQSAAVNSPSDIQLAEFQVVADESTERLRARDGFVARDDATSDGSADTPTARVASRAPRRTFQPRGAQTADFDILARTIDVDLSEVVSKSPSLWKLASLRQNAEVLLEQSDTTLRRGKARLLLEKIKEFETLQLRYAGIDDSSERILPEPSPTNESVTEESSLRGFDPRFDGRGWLLPVHSSRQASPPYALLNQQGQILTFVSPAPGLNLHRYLRKEIGIFGQRSRAEFLNKPHLTADRIVDIERHRR